MMSLIAATCLSAFASLFGVIPSEEQLAITFSKHLQFRAPQGDTGQLGSHLWATGDGPIDQGVLILRRDVLGENVVFNVGIDKNDWIVRGHWQGLAGDSTFGNRSILSDVDGDGFLDAVICNPNGDDLNYGYLWIMSGRDGSIIRRHVGEAVGAFFGEHVTALSDIDSDGWLELLVSSIGLNPNGVFHAGSASIISGKTGQILWRRDGTCHAQLFPSDIDPLGDIDNDGFIDFVIGSNRLDHNGDTHVGGMWVYSGRNQELLFEAYGSRPGELFGAGIDPVGDTDHDGKIDFFVFSNDGYFLYSSGTGNVRYQVPYGDFGGSIHSATDYNGDGASDFWVVPGYSADLRSGVDGKLIGRIPFPISTFTYLSHAEVLGDITGDGLPEVIMAQPADSYDGTIHVYQTDSLTTRIADSLGGLGNEIEMSIRAPALSGQSVALVFAFSAENGTELLGRHIALDDDALYQWSLRHPTWVQLGQNGRGTMKLKRPPQSFPETRDIFAAYVALDPAHPGQLAAVSNSAVIPQ